MGIRGEGWLMLNRMIMDILGKRQIEELLQFGTVSMRCKSPGMRRIDVVAIGLDMVGMYLIVLLV